ncbi:MAG: YihA family ribosome biogenesis GTP-binding protein [Bacteroidales bacterium]|nr:YihA family ribosome biogenesis GTP-binding protein [Bacteroidales bacterium]
MKIKKAAFAGSSTTLKGRPGRRYPEIAFIGRSNVGKSSLINMLCSGAEKITKGKELARTSSSPGKTISVNHFLINDSWYLVDLPGYGYAKVSGKQREELARMNNEYIGGSEELATLFVLLDSRHPLQKVDLDFITALGEEGIPFSIIFTKSDKPGKNELQKNIESVKSSLSEYWEELPPIFVSSSEKNTGKEEIIAHMEQVLDLFKEAKKQEKK